MVSSKGSRGSIGRNIGSIEGSMRSVKGSIGGSRAIYQGPGNMRYVKILLAQ